MKKYYKDNVQDAFKEIEKFNKMTNDNPDISSEKREIINELIELYNLKNLYYLNKIDNNLEKKKK